MKATTKQIQKYLLLCEAYGEKPDFRGIDIDDDHDKPIGVRFGRRYFHVMSDGSAHS